MEIEVGRTEADKETIKTKKIHYLCIFGIHLQILRFLVLVGFIGKQELQVEFSLLF